MYHSHQTFLAGPECEGKEVDVMDFIHCEMYHAMLEKKTPLYAPYVMKLILSKLDGINTRHFTPHKPKTLQVLHGKASKDGSKGAFAPSDDEEAPRASRGSRRKNATPTGDLSPPSPPTKEKVKKLNWFQRTMLCMTTTIHKENHDAYVERKRILHNQSVLQAELNELRGNKKPPKADGEASSEQSEKTISYDKWNCKMVDWVAFSEVTSQPSTSNVDTGKKPVDDDDDEESEYEESEEESG